MWQLSASPIRTADSTALAFTTGIAPGRPRHTGQTCVLGAAPNSVGQPQNIFEAVFSSTCSSSPIAGSNRASAASNDSVSVAVMLMPTLLRLWSAPRQDQEPARAAAHPTWRGGATRG